MPKFKILIPGFILVCFALIVPGCGEDDVPVKQQDPVVVEKEYGAFVVCAGNDQYPPERYLGYYDIKNDSFRVNILAQGQLPQSPNTLHYSDGVLFCPISSEYYPTNQMMFKLGAWGETKGSTLMQIYTNHKISSSLVFGNYLAISYLPGDPLEGGTLEIRNKFSYDWLYRHNETRSRIAAMEYYNNRLFLLLTGYNNTGVDSSLAALKPFEAGLSKVSLRDKPSGIVLTQDGMLVIACSGSSNMVYHVDPETLVKTDSSALSGGFANRLRIYKENSLVFYISKNDKIMKYVPATRTSTVFLNNDLAADGYTISGYNIDQYTGKLYVLYANINTYKPGKMRIYSSSGFFERMIITGKTPVDVVIAKQE